ncbi:MAG: MBL fold metallo-hydrolase [Patescibacteria group bacterium]|nr:MBL fold metallo-hydrolase [Patescibacteria group bacterium]
MQIKFLGTSSGWPLPRLGHHCDICDSTNPEDKRNRSQVLVNENILLDAGLDTYENLIKELEPQKISAILITHGHPDHIFGLWDLGHLYDKKEKAKLFATKETLKKIRQQGLGFEAPSEQIVETFKEYEIAGLKVLFFPVNHSKTTPACGIRLTDLKKSFVYIPDMSNLPEESIIYAKSSQVLIIDGSSLEPTGLKSWGHETIPEGIKLSKKLKAKVIYFTHIGHGKISRPHKQLEQYVQEKGGANFHVAYDGLRLNL